MNNMALVLIQQGRFDEALPPLARAVQLDSSVAVFHNNLGIALERTGQYTMAAQSYRAALSVDSNLHKGGIEPNASGAARRRSVGEPDQARRVGRDIRS